jgi:hypothetical protein
MAKKKSAPFKRFSDAMSKIVRVSKEELAKREAADKARRQQKKRVDTDDDASSVQLAHPDKRPG